MAVSDYPIRTQEYDVDGNRVDEHIFYPVIPYSTTTDSGNHYYWMGGAQSRVFLDIYKKVNTKIELIKKNDDGGIWYKFDKTGVVSTPNGYNLKDSLIFDRRRYASEVGDDWQTMSASIQPTTDDGFAFVASPEGSRTSDNDGDSGYFVNSNTFLERSIVLSSNPLDKIKIQLSVDLIFNFPGSSSGIPRGTELETPPFTLFKWSLSYNNLYMTLNGDWTTAEVINMSFVNIGETFKIDRDYFLPEENISEKNLVFRAYAISVTETVGVDSVYDIYDIAAIETEDLVVGTFVSIAEPIPGSLPTENFFFKIAYYQLKSGSQNDAPTFVRPDDYHSTTNNKYWDRFYISRPYPSLVTGPTSGRGQRTYVPEETQITEMNISFLPNGIEPPEEITSTTTGNVKNNKSLDFNLRFFDLEASFNNQDDIYINYLKYSTGLPTKNWTDTSPDLLNPTSTKSIQDHVSQFLQDSVKIPRAKLNGAIVIRDSNQNPIRGLTPSNTIVDESNDYSMHFLNGMKSINDKGQYKGEALEIGSKVIQDPNGGESSMTAFSDGFNNKAFS